MYLDSSLYPGVVLADGMTAAYNSKSYEIADNNKKSVADLLGLTLDAEGINLYTYMGKTDIFPENHRNAKRNLLLADGTVVNEYLDAQFSAYVRLIKSPDGIIKVSYRKFDSTFSEEQTLPNDSTYEAYLALENSWGEQGLIYTGDTQFESYQPD